MKQYAVLIFTVLVFCNTSAQQPASKAPVPQSEQLEEASRLSAAAVNLYTKGQYDEAASSAKRALEIREEFLAADDGLVLSAVLNLAEIQLTRGKTVEARRLFERALKAHQRIFGVDDVNLIPVLRSLAVVHYRLGEPDQTEKIFQQTLAVAEKSFAADNPEIGRSIFNLAEFYQFQREFKKAEPLYQRLIAMRETSNAGKESLDEARERYACLLRKSNRAKQADELDLTPDAKVVLGIDPEPGGVVNGRATDLVQPPYPPEAKAARLFGTVKVRVLIDENGTVIRACAIDGPGEFREAAEAAARQSRFTATMVSGAPVKVNGLIIYDFR